MAQEFPKISLGGVVGWPKKKKTAFIEQCFARVWPCKIHGLGMVGKEMLLKFPFHSVDASSWEMTPCAFGQWQAFGKLSVRGSYQNLRAEVEWYLRLERQFQARWRQTWEKFNTKPVIRLASSRQLSTTPK